MARVVIWLKADLGTLFKLTKRLRENKAASAKYAAIHYLKWLQERFIKNSNGGAEWPKLQKSTLRKKKWEKKTYGFKAGIRRILYQGGTLFSALGTRSDKNGVVVGLIKPHAGHPKTYKSKKATTISRYHQLGKGSNPIRKIVVLPPVHELAKMREAVRKDIDNFIRRNKRRDK